MSQPSSQQPRLDMRGAFDLSALSRPATPPPGEPGGFPPAGRYEVSRAIQSTPACRAAIAAAMGVDQVEAFGDHARRAEKFSQPLDAVSGEAGFLFELAPGRGRRILTRLQRSRRQLQQGLLHGLAIVACLGRCAGLGARGSGRQWHFLAIRRPSSRLKIADKGT